MVTASIRIVFQNQFVANQDGNFNMKRNLHFVIIDHHCTLLTILLHGSIPESNQIIRIEIVESNVLINRSTVVTSFKFFIIGGEIRKLYHGSVWAATLCRNEKNSFELGEDQNFELLKWKPKESCREIATQFQLVKQLHHQYWKMVRKYLRNLNFLKVTVKRSVQDNL